MTGAAFPVWSRLRTNIAASIKVKQSPYPIRLAHVVSSLDTGGAELQCARLVAFCISAATAEARSPLSFARVAVAGAPNQDAILDLVSPP